MKSQVQQDLNASVGNRQLQAFPDLASLKRRCITIVVSAIGIEIVSRLMEVSQRYPLVLTEAMSVIALSLICLACTLILLRVSRPRLMAAVIIPASLMLLVRPSYGLWESMDFADGGARFNTFDIGLGPNAVLNIFDGIGFGGWFLALFMLMFEALDARTTVARKEKALQEERGVRQETEQLFRELVENATEVICRLNASGRFEYVSPSIRRVLGYEADDLIGHHWSEFVPEDERTRILDYFMTQLSVELPVGYLEFRMLHKDGGEAHVGQTAKVLSDKNGVTGYLSVTRDMTPRVRAEKAQHDSEARYQVLADAMGVVHWEAALPSWDFTYISPRIEKMLGYAAEDWLQADFWANHLHPDDREEAIQFCMTQTQGGMDHEFQYRMISKSGEVVWIRDYVQVVMKDGRPDSLRGFFVDISVLKSAEAEKRVVEKMRQRHERLESLGLLAGSIAHDFNNLLVSLIGHAELAQVALPKEHQSRQHTETILAIGRQAADLCGQLLAYSGQGDLSPRKLNLNDVVREVVHVMNPTSKENDAIVFRLADELPPLTADIAQLRQVIMNLFTNALEATSESGSIVLATGETECSASFIEAASSTSSARPGRYLYLEVKDSGCGMPQEDLKHVLEPFFTTKKDGTGLGLAGTDGILRRHGGFISIESSEGVGTATRAYFPVGAHEDGENGTCIVRRKAASGSVLVVDDDPELLSYTRRLLENKGFDVLTAESAHAGIDCFDKHARDIRAVLMDLSMPEMTGDKAARAIHAIDAKVPIILVSGKAQQDIERRYATEEFSGFVAKPFVYNDLARELSLHDGAYDKD